jgi:hypothetical protein
VAGAQNLLGHLVNDGGERILEYLEGDRIQCVDPSGIAGGDLPVH